MFRIKIPTKRIFQIFPILRTGGMAPFGTYLWNDPRSCLSVFGATQMAQRKRRNGENNRLGLGLG